MIEYLFPTFERKVFPEASCTNPNQREPEVRESTEVYYCVLVDRQFPHECRVKQLHPYTCPDIETGELLYGWTDGSNVFDHFEKDVHDDSERVVAWLALAQEIPLELQGTHR